MPFVVNPADTVFTPQPSGESEDGRLRVVSDATYGGVLLYADFRGLSPLPYRVRFTRDGAPVRSGFDRRSPGGEAIAYDHLASFNTYHTWKATGLAESGQITGVLKTVSLTLQKLPRQRGDGWLKSLNQPSLSQPVRIYDRDNIVARAVTARSSLEATSGSPVMAGSWQPGISVARSYDFKTETLAEADQMWALLGSGLLLMQPQPEFGIGDYFCVPGDISETPLIRLRDPQRVFSVQLIPVEAPPHIDAPLLIPGRNWDTLRKNNLNWSAVAQSRSWGSLLGIDIT